MKLKIMFGQLPRFIQYLIYNNLSNLNQIKCVNKSSYNLVISDDYWKFKICINYGKIVHDKPNFMTYQEWYYRLYNSGNLYITSVVHEKTQCVSKNVHLFRRCLDRYYYIDIFGRVYFNYGSYTDDIPLLIESIYKFGFSIVEYSIIGLGSTEGHSENFQQIQVKDFVLDLIPTYIGDFILYKSSELQFIGEEYQYFEKDIQTIIGNADHVLSLHKNGDLGYYTIEDSILHKRIIASNITRFVKTPNNNTCLYYKSNESQYLLTLTKDKITINETSEKLTNILYNQQFPDEHTYNTIYYDSDDSWSFYIKRDKVI